MAARPRVRKRVCALRRAPDGSAFQKCDICGVSVAIAIADIHDCEHKMEAKRFKGMGGVRRLSQPSESFRNQPMSAFRCFMVTFAKAHLNDTLYEFEKMGFEKWQNMSDEEKYDYMVHSEILNSYHQYQLDKEAEEIVKVDDEADSADSAMVVKKPMSAVKTRVIHIIDSTSTELGNATSGGDSTSDGTSDSTSDI